MAFASEEILTGYGTVEILTGEALASHSQKKSPHDSFLTVQEWYHTVGSYSVCDGCFAHCPCLQLAPFNDVLASWISWDAEAQECLQEFVKVAFKNCSNSQSIERVKNGHCRIPAQRGLS